MPACRNVQQQLEDTADSGARDVGPKESAEEQDEALYTQVLDGLCALATDPAPRVCRRGEAALKLSNVELHLLSPSGLSPDRRRHLLVCSPLHVHACAA